MSEYHEPVMGREVLELLSVTDSGLYLDGTAGGGGHTRMILEECETCRVIAVDRDPEALEEARGALAEVRARVRFVSTRFDRAVSDPEIQDRGLDGALLDLGVSSHQLDADERGFTFRRGVKLDMRMEAEGRDAAAFLAQTDEEELTRVFREFGEEPRARRLAREIVKRRATEPLSSSDDLVAAMAVTLRRSPGAKEKARIFQAVRIAVNKELESLEAGLPAIRDVLKVGGVMVVIAYHSLEDRVVKNAFREWSKACVCPPELPVCTCRGEPLGETLTRKVLRPSAQEVEKNPRARSARLRAWRRAA
ncbi:MAG: 16S rRNA (cytosine(1402)-N(4))-methyltransferase RsmH [Longimicrobiales bacterium]|jgi:16S rRNA (cytosine1402-N4)-methyltransferase|nr:16S rRNA (cytosine(1402)-N(4))-methyltransferase RsmH [Longimicrobiales bacterium]